jgi:hypothetical protein
MVRAAKREAVDREAALYDRETVERLVEEYGDATAIKRHVRTSAMVRELRAATWYWVYDKPCPGAGKSSMASQRVWETAKAVDEGRTEVNL